MLEGECRVGGQDHFYLETHACIAVPKGEDEIEIIATAQGVACVQKCVSQVLGVPRNKIVCKIKRIGMCVSWVLHEQVLISKCHIGGGFGGKETRNCYLSTAVTVAANK